MVLEGRHGPELRNAITAMQNGRGFWWTRAAITVTSRGQDLADHHVVLDRCVSLRLRVFEFWTPSISLLDDCSCLPEVS